MSAAPLIDAAILDDLIEYIGRDALRPVIDLFLEEARTLAAAIVEAAADANGRETVRRAAHSLKSSSGQLGAAALSEAAVAAEHAAEAGAPLGDRGAAVAEIAAATIAAFSARMAADPP